MPFSIKDLKDYLINGQRSWGGSIFPGGSIPQLTIERNHNDWYVAFGGQQVSGYFPGNRRQAEQEMVRLQRDPKELERRLGHKFERPKQICVLCHNETHGKCDPSTCPCEDRRCKSRKPWGGDREGARRFVPW